MFRSPAGWQARTVPQIVKRIRDFSEEIAETIAEAAEELLATVAERRVLRLSCMPIFPDRNAVLDRGDADFTATLQEQLAEAADVSLPTIKRLEANDGPLGGRSGTGAKIQAALEAAGVGFIDENGGGAGVRLRKPAKEKSRK